MQEPYCWGQKLSPVSVPSKLKQTIILSTQFFYYYNDRDFTVYWTARADSYYYSEIGSDTIMWEYQGDNPGVIINLFLQPEWPSGLSFKTQPSWTCHEFNLSDHCRSFWASLLRQESTACRMVWRLSRYFDEIRTEDSDTALMLRSRDEDPYYMLFVNTYWGKSCNPLFPARREWCFYWSQP